jgi:RND family efflux transporter MFP subunit
MRHWPSLLLTLSLSLAWSLVPRAATGPQDDGVTPVKVFSLEQPGMAGKPRFAARIEAGDSTQLAFRTGGQLQTLHVHMGARVRKGQLLAELDPTDYRLNLDARKAEYDLARLGAERARTLYGKKLISEDQYDTAQTLLATRRAQLEQAREQLSFCRLLAPYSGNIAFTYAMPSEVVAAYEPILNLQDVSRLEIHFNLPPRYEPLIEGPDPVRFTVEFDLLPGVRLDADYKEVSLQPDPDTNSYPVTLVVSSPENFSARPGMPATVRLHHPALLPDGWVLPPEALFERAGNAARVWRIDSDMTIHKTPVQLDGEGVVRQGLNPGDRIVAAGVNRLREGQKVRVWEREEGL